MTTRAVAFLALLLLVAPGARGQHTEHDDVQVIKPPEVKPRPDEKKPDLKKAAEDIVERTNAFRKEQGRSALSVDAKLTRAAAYFAGYMAREDRYGHTADGKRPAERAKEHGYEYCIVLENIAYQYNSRGLSTAEAAEGFFEGWKESPGHRKNMLDADVTDTAVVIARSENTGYYYAVQLFGRPKSKAIEFTISNQSGEAVEYEIGEQKFTLSPRYSRTHTQCRPPEVVIRKEDGKKVRPTGGERYEVTDEGVRVRKR